MLFCAAALVFSAELPAGVPKGATEVAPGRYRFVDKDQKVWNYRVTPFGVQRSAAEAKDESATPAPDKTVPELERPRTETPFGKSKASYSNTPVTTATEVGDSIRFERPNPFGVSRWTKKKTDLTPDERRVWESQTKAPERADKQ